MLAIQSLFPVFFATFGIGRTCSLPHLLLAKLITFFTPTCNIWFLLHLFPATGSYTCSLLRLPSSTSIFRLDSLLFLDGPLLFFIVIVSCVYLLPYIYSPLYISPAKPLAKDWKGDFWFDFFLFMCAIYHCVGGCWDRNQDCCDQCCGSGVIRILFFNPSRIPDPGVKKAQDSGSGSASLIATWALTARCSNHSARSHPLAKRYWSIHIEVWQKWDENIFKALQNFVLQNHIWPLYIC